MLGPMLIMARAAGGGVVVPAVSGVTVSSAEEGSCFAGTLETPAGVLVSWTVANPDVALYELRVYENDVQVASLVCSATSWDKTVTGHIEGGPYIQWTSDWVYRVDVVRLSDSVVVSSATSAAWQQAYGVCGGEA